MTSNNIRPGASAAVFKNGHVLLIQRARGAFSGLWSLPGGHVMDGEHPMDTAIREVMEETGIQVRITGLVERITVSPSIDILYEISVFYGDWVSGEPVAASDAAGAQWILPSEIQNLATTDGLAEIIARAVTLREEIQ